MSKRCMGCMKTYDKQYDVCPHCGYAEGTPPKESYHMVPGTVLHGRYIIGQVVGYGGFGVTYAGWDLVLEQKVAVKEYLPSEFATRVPGEETVTVYSGEKTTQFDIGCAKFSDEAKRLAQFNAVDGVVEIKDTFRDNQTSYIVMEFLEGETLKARIKREGKIPPEEAIEITKSILSTLEQVHKGEIIHRDIAPDNIFLCSDGRIKLLDFGASRYATVQHSKSLSVILKEGYAPEEQYRSKGEQGSWSDVYAVGATLYKMLTGVTPEDAMERAEKDKLKPVSKYGVKLSKEAETALMNALNVFSEDRTQTAEEFKTELEADTVKRKERTRKKIDLGKWPLWSKILVGCIALALGATGFILSQQSVYALEDGKAYVPEVINMKDEKAQKIVEKNQLILKIIGQEKSEKVEQAKVMTQYPDAGRVVNIGELVEVKISAGNAVVMLDLAGMTKEEAEEVLKTLGFTKIEYAEEASAAPAGTIISQSIETGKETNVNDTIKLTVSKGLEEVNTSKNTTVPKLTGMMYEKAAEKATASKLYVVKGEVKASEKPAGTVIGQDIKSGKSVKEGTTITLTLSAGESKIEVPYVEYLSESEAKRILSAYNLKYSVSYKKSNTVKSGLVMSQGTAAGKQVKPGTKITLVVSEGRETVEVPSVKGMSYNDAIRTLQNIGFRYSVTYKHSESIAWGEVMEQSLGGKQEKGTKIDIVASKGTAGMLVDEDTYNAKYNNNKYSVSARPLYSYKIRQKEYATGGTSTMSSNNGNPWNLYDTETSTQTSGYWFGSYPDNSDKVIDGKRVQKTVVSKGKAYKAYSFGGNDKNGNHDRAFYINDTLENVRKHYFDEYKAEPKSTNVYFLWYIGSETSTEESTKGKTVNVCFDENCSRYSTVKDGTAYVGENQHLYFNAYCYKIKTTTTMYKFERWSSWSDWSEWSNSPVSDSDSMKVQTKPMYYVTGKAPN